ncbi:MAG TPA: hypothetical protein VEQ10_20255 [Vicinamibacteria bacterium]|nr:hypothetical protein [Vicinamibacteria bacterium]
MRIPPRRLAIVLGLACLTVAASSAFAEVPLTGRQLLKRNLKQAGHARRKGESTGAITNATGSQALIDASGVRWFINTDITFSTSSSASGAMSEASYTHAVVATTASGGTTSSTLNDAFDGYNTLCLSLNNTVATCQTGNANFVIYDKLGAAASECMGAASGVNRQIVFPTMTSGTLQISRKVFVPDNDSFARWMNTVKNTDSSPATVTLVTANNLGSDANTLIVTSSDGNATADVTDTWVTTFQNYSGATSSDPRLGHVLQGKGAAVPLAGVAFANGDDNPYWGYTVTLAPGETASFLNFAVAKGTKAEAASEAARLAAFPPIARQCLTTAELATVKNFNPTATGPHLFYPVTPCRVADTRKPAAPNGGPALAANATRDFPVAGACGVPATASAVALNITVVDATATGDLRVYPAGGSLPSASTINFPVSRAKANNADVRLSADGKISVKCDMAQASTGHANFLIDVTGYFQ